MIRSEAPGNVRQLPMAKGFCAKGLPLRLADGGQSDGSAAKPWNCGFQMKRAALDMSAALERSNSILRLERVDLCQALLLLLLAGGFVALVHLGLLGFAVGGSLGALSGFSPGLMSFTWIGASAGFSAAGTTVLFGPTGLTKALGSEAAAPPGATAVLLGALTTSTPTRVPSAGASICNGAVEG